MQHVFAFEFKNLVNNQSSLSLIAQWVDDFGELVAFEIRIQVFLELGGRTFEDFIGQSQDWLDGTVVFFQTDDFVPLKMFGNSRMLATLAPRNA